MQAEPQLALGRVRAQGIEGVPQVARRDRPACAAQLQVAEKRERPRGRRTGRSAREQCLEDRLGFPDAIGLQQGLSPYELRFGPHLARGRRHRRLQQRHGIGVAAERYQRLSAQHLARHQFAGLALGAGQGVERIERRRRQLGAQRGPRAHERHRHAPVARGGGFCGYELASDLSHAGCPAALAPARGWVRRAARRFAVGRSERGPRWYACAIMES